MHLYLGNAYVGQGKLDAALGEYEVAHQLNPDLAQVHYEAAKALSGKGDYAGAVARCQEGLAREPSSSYGLFTLGTIYRLAGKSAEAADAFARVIAENENDPRAQSNLADMAIRLGRFDVAGAACRKMIDLGYRVAPAHYNLGFIAERSGDPRLALVHYRAALAADPGFKPAQEAIARLKRD